MYTEFGQADVVCVTDVGDVEAAEGGDRQRAAEVIKVNYAFRSFYQDLLERI